jgi:hypothetical protein
MSKNLRAQYKEAVAAQDWEAASAMVLANPSIFGTAPNVDDVEITALASDPTKVTYMIVEWKITNSNCADCKPITLTARQFDHLEGKHSAKKIQEWFDGYVQNRTEHHKPHRRFGNTLFLVKVDQISQITDFKGELL